MLGIVILLIIIISGVYLYKTGKLFTTVEKPTTPIEKPISVVAAPVVDPVSIVVNPVGIVVDPVIAPVADPQPVFYGTGNTLCNTLEEPGKNSCMDYINDFNETYNKSGDWYLSALQDCEKSMDYLFKIENDKLYPGISGGESLPFTYADNDIEFKFDDYPMNMSRYVNLTEPKYGCPVISDDINKHPTAIEINNKFNHSGDWYFQDVCHKNIPYLYKIENGKMHEYPVDLYYTLEKDGYDIQAAYKTENSSGSSSLSEFLWQYDDAKNGCATLNAVETHPEIVEFNTLFNKPGPFIKVGETFGCQNAAYLAKIEGDKHHSTVDDGIPMFENQVSIVDGVAILNNKPLSFYKNKFLGYNFVDKCPPLIIP